MAAAVAVAMEAVVAVDMESEKAELSALSHNIPFVNFCQKIIIIIIVIIVTTNTIIMIIVSITIAFIYPYHHRWHLPFYLPSSDLFYLSTTESLLRSQL
jgi:hypothetical protein